MQGRSDMAHRRERLSRAVRRIAAGVLAGVLLSLAACGIDAPGELEPVERGAQGCPSLRGTWDFSSMRGLANAFPGDPLPPWLENSVTAVRIAPTEEPSRLEIDFLADAEAIIAAAEALRRSDPARHASWRKQVEAGAPDAAVAEDGPALSLRRTLDHVSCRDGWWSLGYDRRPIDQEGRHSTGIALSRNRAGALLVSRHFSQTKSAGFNFFGQNVTYERDGGSSVTMLAPRADAQALSTRRLRDLPLGVDPALLKKWRAEAPDRIVGISARLQARLPAEALRGFKVLNLDVSQATSVPDHFRIEWTASFPTTTRGDPLIEALQGLPEVSGIEIVHQRESAYGGRETSVQFEYRD